MCGKLECVQVLLDCGSKVDAADSRGNTALHHCAARNDQEMADILHQKNAVMDVPNMVRTPEEGWLDGLSMAERKNTWAVMHSTTLRNHDV